MAQYYKSSKLLNKATIDGSNNLQLYCELDHFFLPGDKVIINGGYYDNSSNSSFTSFNPFTNSYYTVIATDPTQNRITLDLKIVGTLYFPYAAQGATTNIYGDPTDVIDIAYNYYNNLGNRDLYKDIYISSAGFVRGKFKSGKIQNGIFGCDKTKVELNDTQYNATSKSKLNITHIAAKNVKIPAGTIGSKTYGSLNSTNKFRVQESIMSSFPLNNIIVGQNNDGYGYSYFEKAKIGDSTNPLNYFVDINNCWMSNSGANAITGANIELWGVNVNNSKIGNNDPIEYDFAAGTYGANQIHGINATTAYLGNIFTAPTDRIQLDGGTVNSSIALNFPGGLLNVSYGAPGYVNLTVNYADVANKYFDPTFLGYLTGLTIAATGKPEEQFHTLVYITSVSYFFGADDVFPTGATMQLFFPTLTGSWLSILASYPNPGVDLDWSGIKFYNAVGYGGGSIVQNALLQGSLNLDTLLVGNYPSNTDVYVKSNTGTVVISGGFYGGLALEGAVNVIGASYKNMVTFNGVTQITPFGQPLNLFTYLLVLSSNTIYTGAFYNSILNSGAYTNSLFTDCHIKHNGTSNFTFLYNCDITGYTVVDNDPMIEWEYCSFNPVVDYYLPGPVLVEGGRFKDRKTAWATGYQGNLNNPVPIGSKTYNKNNKKPAANAPSPPLSALGIFKIPVAPMYKYTATFVPYGKSLLAATTTNLLYALIDVGDYSILPGPVYQPLFNRDKLLISDVLSVNTTLDTIINNVDTLTPALSFDNRFTNPPVYIASTFGLDTNFEYNYDGYYNDAKTPDNVATKPIIFETPPNPIPTLFTNVTGGIPNVEIWIDLVPTLFGTTFNIPLGNEYSSPFGAPSIVNTGIQANTYYIQMTTYAWTTAYGNQTLITPKGFIEIEGYTINKMPAGGGPIYDSSYTPLRLSLSNNYSDIGIMGYNGFYNVPMKTPVIVDVQPTERVEIIVDFWITPYWCNSPYSNKSGFKKKHTYTWVVENP